MPKILYAEDVRDLRRDTADLLTFGGYEVEEVENGQELLDKLALCRKPAVCTYDLVVTDLEMPRMAGSVVLRWARLHGFTVPFIVLGVGGSILQAQIEEAGGIFLQKNAPPQEFLGAVERACGGTKSA